MKKAAEYRRHAQECQALARNAATEQERTQFLEISATWNPSPWIARISCTGIRNWLER